MLWLIYLLAAVALIAAGLLLRKQRDRRLDEAACQSLIATQSKEGAVFELPLVAELPEPARRYFAFVITPGTPIRTVASIEMTGELGTGTKAAPHYRAMNAEQILAPPHGLVWKVSSGPLSGSDGLMPDASWTRFWLFNLIPVVRAKGADHHRSAFGRAIAEAAIWAPASLLPGESVSWEYLDHNTARAIVKFESLTQAVDITVDAFGAPTEVLIQRWSNENAVKRFREQPFGGYLSEFRHFNGYCLPTRVEGGNHFGTPNYFPFYRAHVHAIAYPTPGTELPSLE